MSTHEITTLQWNAFMWGVNATIWCIIGVFVISSLYDDIKGLIARRRTKKAQEN